VDNLSVGEFVVESLAEQHVPEIAELLALSFRVDPAFVALFRELPPRPARSYRTFMRLWAHSVFRLGHSVFGARVNGNLAGAVGVTPAGVPRHPVSLADLALLPALICEMRLGVGLSLAKATRRPSDVARITPEVSMLAVSPLFQSQGIASNLLRVAHSTLAERSESREVYLYTTAAASRRFYEKQGYRLVLDAQARGVNVYHMLRLL